MLLAALPVLFAGGSAGVRGGPFGGYLNPLLVNTLPEEVQTAIPIVVDKVNAVAEGQIPPALAATLDPKGYAQTALDAGVVPIAASALMGTGVQPEDCYGLLNMADDLLDANKTLLKKRCFPEIQREVLESFDNVKSEAQSMVDTVKEQPFKNHFAEAPGDENLGTGYWWQRLVNGQLYFSDVLSLAESYFIGTGENVRIVNQEAHDLLTQAHNIVSEDNQLLNDLSDVFTAYGDEKEAPFIEKGNEVMADRQAKINEYVNGPLDNLEEWEEGHVDSAVAAITRPQILPRLINNLTSSVSGMIHTLGEATYIAENYPLVYYWIEPILHFIVAISDVVNDLGTLLGEFMTSYWTAIGDEVKSAFDDMTRAYKTRGKEHFKPWVDTKNWFYAKGKLARVAMDNVAAKILGWEEKSILHVVDDKIQEEIEVNEARAADIATFQQDPEAYIISFINHHF
jgi:hypothetical protein